LPDCGRQARLEALGKRLVFIRQDEQAARRKKILGNVGDDLVLTSPAG
jgi:hypothetical protein